MLSLLKVGLHAGTVGPHHRNLHYWPSILPSPAEYDTVVTYSRSRFNEKIDYDSTLYEFNQFIIKHFASRIEVQIFKDNPISHSLTSNFSASKADIVFRLNDEDNDPFFSYTYTTDYGHCDITVVETDVHLNINKETILSFMDLKNAYIRVITSTQLEKIEFSFGVDKSLHYYKEILPRDSIGRFWPSHNYNYGFKAKDLIHSN